MASLPEVFSQAARKAMAGRAKRSGPDGGNADGRSSRHAVARLEALGVTGVGAKSDADDIVDYLDRLWHDQDDLVAPLEREWMLGLLYPAGSQHLAYHRDQRTWIPKRHVAGRVRSTYNVLDKAVRVRVSRLTENKPTVSVVAATSDQQDIQRVEYKETLFWALWAKLNVHQKMVAGRRWATKTGSGFLKVGYDPEAGVATPVTRFREVYDEIQVPVMDDLGQPVIDWTGQPLTELDQVFRGTQEFYLDAEGQELGPVEIEEPDPKTGQAVKKRQEPPPETDYVYEGEVYLAVRSPFNIRFDRYAERLEESWYVQDTHLMSAAAIASQFPDKVREIAAADPADDASRMLGAPGLARLTDPTSGPLVSRGRSSDGSDSGQIDREYVVRETWIYPTTQLIRKLWGPRGRYLVTVGGTLVHNSPLPEWAVKARNYIQLIDTPEEGNHYGKPFLRDLIPLQDDINRTRSILAESMAVRARPMMSARQNHGINLTALGGMPGVLVTHRGDAEPKALNFGQAGQEGETYYRDSLAAHADLANTNDASQGKLPSAGIAAQAIYALQYADEKSVSEASTLQDEALRHLALAIDAVTRVEYRDERKIRIVGDDRSYLAQADIRPEHLDVEVDYFFAPGSMLSRNKEAIRNEALALRKEGLLDDATTLRFFSASVPDMLRRSNQLPEARARRLLDDVLTGQGTAAAGQPQFWPWDNPDVILGVFEEFGNTARFEKLEDDTRNRFLQVWQALKVLQQQRMQALAAAQAGAQPPAGQQVPGAPGQPGGAEAQVATGGEQLGAPEQPFQAPEGAGLMQAQANAAMEPPTPQ